MYFMGNEEFKQYLYSEAILKDMEREHSLAVRRAYADIHPTRVAFDGSEGKMYSESINVMDYAIYLIDLKQVQQEDIERTREKVYFFHEALAELSTEEAGTIRKYLEKEPALNPKFVQQSMNSLKHVLEKKIKHKNLRKSLR